MSPLLGRLLIGRRGLTVEFISPPVASDIVFDSRQIKKKKKKYLCMCGRGLSLKGLITIDSFLLAPCEQI